MHRIDRLMFQVIGMFVLVFVAIYLLPRLFYIITSRLNDMATGVPDVKTDGNSSEIATAINDLASQIIEAFYKTVSSLLTGIASIFTAVIGIVLVGALCGIVALMAAPINRHLTARRDYNTTHDEATRLITALPDRDAILTEIGLHAVDLPDAKAKELHQSAELLAIKLGNACSQYHRYMNTAVSPSVKRHSTKKYTTATTELTPILKELKKHHAAWKLIDNEITTVRREMDSTRLNERLLVLEIGLRNSDGINAKQHRQLTAQTARLRRQFHEKSRSKWEIHIDLQSAEKRAHALSPTQFDALNTA